MLIDFAPVQLPPAELQAAIALRESKVARLKEQMGRKYLLHSDNMVRASRAIPYFLIQKKTSEVEDEQEEFESDALCANCNGSGEGPYDGTRCIVCKGSGVIK